MIRVAKQRAEAIERVLTKPGCDETTWKMLVEYPTMRADWLLWAVRSVERESRKATR